MRVWKAPAPDFRNVLLGVEVTNVTGGPDNGNIQLVHYLTSDGGYINLIMSYPNDHDTITDNGKTYYTDPGHFWKYSDLSVILNPPESNVERHGYSVLMINDPNLGEVSGGVSLDYFHPQKLEGKYDIQMVRNYTNVQRVDKDDFTPALSEDIYYEYDSYSPSEDSQYLKYANPLELSLIKDKTYRIKIVFEEYGFNQDPKIQFGLYMYTTTGEKPYKAGGYSDFNEFTFVSGVSGKVYMILYNLKAEAKLSISIEKTSINPFFNWGTLISAGAFAVVAGIYVIIKKKKS